MVSVCLGTYQGEKYIYQQLESILNQNYAPDEVIICDDNSKDKTATIIEEFIENNQLEGKWKLYINSENKGYPQNFYYVMSLCHGDYVLLADQDDIWEKDKISSMLEEMEGHPEIQLLISNWGMIDADGKKLGQENAFRDNREPESIVFSDILYSYKWPGMAMCYRKQLGNAAIECAGNTMLPHDLMLAVLATQMDGFFKIGCVLQYHRRHENNVAREEHRILKRLDKSRKLEEIDLYLKHLELLKTCGSIQKEEDRELLDTKHEIMFERKNNLAKGKRLKILQQYFRHKNNIRFATVVCDLVICKRAK